MDKNIKEFQELHALFRNNGFKLYLVGGTVRDYLLGLPLNDMDAVTDATPEDMKEFLSDANYTFARFGSISFKTQKKVKFDITTMREETSYNDSRHPGKIKFVKDLNIDVKRRDFTVNALYLDENLKVIDLVDGVSDLNKKVLRMIGEPEKRLKEDPLRIFRAIRFAADYGFKIDEELDKAIMKCSELVNNLNIEKIKMDLGKSRPSSKEIVLQYLKKYHIKLNENVIE